MVIEKKEYVEGDIVLDPRCKEGKLHLDRRGLEPKNREKENGRYYPPIVDNPFPLYLMNTFEVNQDFMNGEYCTFYSFLEKILGEESVAGNILMDEYCEMNEIYSSGKEMFKDISLYRFVEILDEIKGRLRRKGEDENSKGLQTLYYAMSMAKDYILNKINKQVSDKVKGISELGTYSLEDRFSSVAADIYYVISSEQYNKRSERDTFSSFLEKFFGGKSTVENILMNEYSKIGGYSEYISLYEFAEILDRIADRLSKEGKSKDSKEMQVLYYAKSMLDNYLFGSKTIMENCLVLIPGFIEKSFGFYDQRLYNSLYMYMGLDEYEGGYQVSVKEFLERFKSWMKKFNVFISGIVKEHQTDKGS